jgi:hypothetical protein
MNMFPKVQEFESGHQQRTASKKEGPGKKKGYGAQNTEADREESSKVIELMLRFAFSSLKNYTLYILKGPSDETE